MSEKLVTVLVAIYNAGDFIAAKIDNLLQQSIINDIHIVFLNCKNADNERQHYEHLLSGDIVSCHEIVYHDFIGLYRSWNDGIQTSKSKYICNSNVDDMWHPDYLSKCTNHLNNLPDVAVVSSNVIITKTSNQSDYRKWSCITGKMPNYVYPLSTAGPCPVWRRSLHEKYGYFGDYLTIGDAKMWEKWLNGGEKFDLIREELTLYYASANSLERRIDKKTGKYYRDIDLMEHK